MAPRLSALLVLGVLAAGCGGSSGAGRPAAPEVRGVRIDAFSCAAASRVNLDRSSAGPAVATVGPDEIKRVRLCPLTEPQRQPAVDLTPADAVFGPLVQALSKPDVAPSAGPCPEYADLPQTVLAEGPAGPLVVFIPVDGCGHYQSDALAALSRARATAPRERTA